MKDSIFAIPCYDVVIDNEIKQANKKQKRYDLLLDGNGTLLPVMRQMKPHDAFNFLKNCKCCLIHQTNKPTKLELWRDFYNDQEPYREVKPEKACKCDCRQLSRMLCRGKDLKRVPI